MRVRTFYSLSPNIHIQIIITDLHTFPDSVIGRICKKVKAIPFVDYFISSHNLFS